MVTKNKVGRAIVISGLPASGKSTLAEMLSKEYGLPIYSMGKLWRERWREAYPNGEVSFEEFWGHTTIQDNMKVNREAKALFESGTVIADTRYPSLLNRDKCILIFVKADINIRAERAAAHRADYSGKSIGEVKAILRKREDDEARMGMDLFGVDYRNERFYHLVIDSALLTPREEFWKVKKKLARLRRTDRLANLRR